MKDMLKFDLPKGQSSIIKVMGVGGGGSNAVTHMFEQGIKGVDFIICNTDAQAMEESPVPVKIQLGDSGLGAGAIPSVGREAALQKTEEIKELLVKNTKMLFITAGMGGGTGTGAAPVIAQMARELEILTVGIVTIPFSFEGRRRFLQAEEGIKELKKHVDTLLIICNDKIRELYGDLKLSDAFHKADDVLTQAAKGIAEIITVPGHINVDFEDVKTVMKNSGRAIMGSAEAEGEKRAIRAVKEALASPLLNDNDVEGAGNILLYITSGDDEITMDEVNEITEHILTETKVQADIIWGNGTDKSLKKKICITLIATGFDAEKKRKEAIAEKKITHFLKDDIANEQLPPIKPETNGIEIEGIQLINKNRNTFERVLKDDFLEEEIDEPSVAESSIFRSASRMEEEPVEEKQHDLREEAPPDNVRTFLFTMDNEPEQEAEMADAEEDKTAEKVVNEVIEDQTASAKKPFELYIKKPSIVPAEEKVNGKEIPVLKTRERIEKLKSLSMKLKNEEELEKIESEPAYKRKNISIDAVNPSEESSVSRYFLYETDENKVEIRKNNTFLHDNVD